MKNNTPYFFIFYIVLLHTLYRISKTYIKRIFKYSNLTLVAHTRRIICNNVISKDGLIH